jgi:hypothetical protein
MSQLGNGQIDSPMDLFQAPEVLPVYLDVPEEEQ